uniref:Groucho/TLE N-terminal Q-rich domain-containing protein n=1 Tax=Zonotrichia albicollis TaxID=44394 RepID=A0A8D2NI66_ZONAL
MQRHYVMYYEMSYGLNIEMHKQAEIVKRLNGICAQVLPYLSQEVSPQFLGCVGMEAAVPLQCHSPAALTPLGWQTLACPQPSPSGQCWLLEHCVVLSWSTPKTSVLLYLYSKVLYSKVVFIF